MRKAFVSGLGVVTPIGTGVHEFWDGLLAGRSGAGVLSSFDPSAFPVRIAAEVRDFDPSSYMEGRESARMDRFCQMAVAAASLALDHAGIPTPDPDRTAVIVGTGIGGLATIEQENRRLLEGGPRRVGPFMVPRLMPNGAAGAIAMHHGFHGPNFGVASACATGAHALGVALDLVRAGRADVVLAGGSESALTPLSISAFARMGALSRRNDDPEGASRPFDKGRDGFLFGEGSGVLVIESEEHLRARDGDPLVELAGFGASADAFHVTQPDPAGAGARRAMLSAMEDAGVAPGEVDYINAHGTSTPYNDRIETIAIKAAFGNEAKRLPVTSTKSQTGHLLGAAGAVEAAATTMTLLAQTIPRTLNLEEPDPECDLDHVPEGPREERINVALSNSFGFGGQNASLVLRRVA